MAAELGRRQWDTEQRPVQVIRFLQRVQKNSTIETDDFRFVIFFGWLARFQTSSCRQCARGAPRRHDQHHLHHHCVGVSNIGYSITHSSAVPRLCMHTQKPFPSAILSFFTCKRSLTTLPSLTWSPPLGHVRRDVLVEKHYRSVLGRVVLDPFFAAHTKVTVAPHQIHIQHT
jgi:hypothetical protein